MAAPLPATATIVPEDPWSETKLKEAVEVWNLTPSQEQQLRVLQIKLKDIQHEWNDPHVVLGYCTTSPDGFQTAEASFRAMIEWRLHNRVDELLTNYKPNPLVLDNSPIAFLKDYDKDGDPIYLERGGAVDVKGLLERFSRDELMQHAIWLREVQSSGAWVDEYERRQGRPVCNITVVYDLEGLCARHLQPSVLGWFQQLMRITENYYPGPIKRMIIIRAPAIFRIGWATIKHFFSAESQDKMIFADSDHLAVLEKYMDLDALPSCINPTGKGETAIGMPKRMEGGLIDNHVGKGGQGYVPDPRNSGISGAKPTEAASVVSSTGNTQLEKTAAALSMVSIAAL